MVNVLCLYRSVLEPALVMVLIQLKLSNYQVNSSTMEQKLKQHIIANIIIIDNELLGPAAIASIVVCTTVVLLIVMIIGIFIYTKCKPGRVFL